MSALGKRVLRLEGPRGPDLPPVAVVSAPIPAVATVEWAAELLAAYGWSGFDLSVNVYGGEPDLLLPPTPFAWLKGDAEDIWLSGFNQYPNAMIISRAEGLIVNRFESEAHFRRRMFDIERELAA